jgi:hypothetical protein
MQRTRFPQLSGYGRHAGAHVGPIPPFRPSYAIYPGDRIEVEVVQPDGGRALVVGRLNAVPESAGGARYGFGVRLAHHAAACRAVALVTGAEML